MSSELWTSLMFAILSVPLAITANILSPKVQNWLDSRNKKPLEKQGQEELRQCENPKERAKRERKEQVPLSVVAKILSPKVQDWVDSRNKKSLENQGQGEHRQWKYPKQRAKREQEEKDDLQIYSRETKIVEGDKEQFHEETEVILKNRLIIAGILYAPAILFILGGLLGIFTNAVFLLLFILSVVPSVRLLIRLIQHSILILKYKRENKKGLKEETEKLKNNCISIGIIYLPFVMFFIIDPKNTTLLLLFFLSIFMSFYFIIQAIIAYIRLLKGKVKIVGNLENEHLYKP